MIWTPAIPPPHPSTIPSLSPLAQSVLALIRREGQGGGSESGPRYRAVTRPLYRHQNSANTDVQLERSEATDSLFDFQSSTSMNPLTDAARLAPRYNGNLTTEFDSNSPYSTSQILPGYENRPFNVSLTNNNQQREQYLRSFYSQTQPSERCRESVREANQTQTYLSPFGPSVQITDKVGINQLDNLSPDMEFDDVEIYSCPPNEQEKENDKVFHSEKNFAPKNSVATNGLNFKEIKPRPLQKRGLQINTPLPPPIGNVNQISIPNNMQPSDQTFILNSVNPVPKFKKTLAKFKNTPGSKSNQNSSFIQKTREDEARVQSVLKRKIYSGKRTFNETELEKGYQKSTNDIMSEDHFELDDVFDQTFDDAFNKMEEKVKGSGSMKRSLTNNISTNSLKVTCNVSPSNSTRLSTKWEGVTGYYNENTDTKIVSKEQEGQNILGFSTSDSNTNRNSELSENLFIKNQESIKNVDCVQDRVELKQADLSTIQPFQENVINYTSVALSQQPDLSENLFVKTQESVIAQTNNLIENRVNILGESYPSEEFSIPPYQKPFESEDSPDFDVDNLFSLQDESFKEPLAVLKGQSDSNKDLKCGEGKEEKFISCDRGSATMFNVASTSLIKSHEKITMPIKSKYFQAENDKEESNKELDSGSNESGGKGGNCNSIINSKLSKRVKEKTILTFGTDSRGIHREQVVEGNIELERGKPLSTTNSFGKKTALKQSTLFDCRKFQSGTKNTDLFDSQRKPNTQPVEVAQTENFKKPLPPAKKAKKERTKPKIANVKNSEKSQSVNNSGNDSHSRNSGVNEFLQSNTPLLDIKNRCNPSKLVQKNLKNQNVSTVTTQKKRSKKPSFVPPIAASHLTSQQVAIKDYTITVMDEVSATEILNQIDSEELTKVVTTVTFKEGYTLLNKPEDQKKNSRCFPSGVMFMLGWPSGKCGYHWLPLADLAAISPSVVKLVDTLMSRGDRNICFEAQAVFMLLMDTLRLRDVSRWIAFDPLIGCWLLDPDNPPRDFREAASKLEMDQSLLVIHPQANTRNQACSLLPVLDTAMDLLQSRLVNASLWTVFCDMETRLVPVLAAMETETIAVDVDRLHRMAELMEKRLRGIQSQAHEMADRWFQLNSPQQLREILFDKLKLDEKFGLKIKKTEHGVKSTSESVLEQMKDLHPLPKLILEYRRLQKVKSTYVDGLIQHVKSDGTVGTSWEQVSTATGRVSSKNPNLQAFPKSPIAVAGGETIQLREMFLARAGCSFLAADFQQIEFRVFAHFTQDKSLLQAFREGGDIFQRLAERWLGGRGEEEREKTKRIVYSVMYGAGASKLSEYLRVEQAEAYKIIDNFVAIFPSLRSLPRAVVAQCRAQGYVATLSGRRRLFPHIRSAHGALRSSSERQAVNFLIQGSAADICKAAMLDCEVEIRARGLKAKLLLMIHDELVWEVDDQDLTMTAATVREAMEHRWNKRLTLLVPIPVSVSTGKTLGNMKTMSE